MQRTRYTGLAVLAFLLLAVVGCGPLNFGLNSRAVTITIDLDESILNRLLSEAQNQVTAVSGETLLAEISQIDFQAPDTIRVFGSRNQNGSTIEGNFDVRTVLDQGALKVNISAVNIPGYSLDSPAIQQINNELSKAFTEQINQQQEGAISSVQVTADALSLVIEVPFR